MKRLSILFVLIMLVGSATIAMAGPCRSGNAVGPGYGMGPNALAKLNLTDEQVAKTQTLREAHLRETIPPRNQLFSKRAELRLLWTQTSPDQEKIIAKQKEINELRGQLQEKATRYRLEFHKILTPEQQARLMAYRLGRGCCASGNWGRMGRW